MATLGSSILGKSAQAVTPRRLSWNAGSSSKDDLIANSSPAGATSSSSDTKQNAKRRSWGFSKTSKIDPHQQAKARGPTVLVSASDGGNPHLMTSVSTELRLATALEHLVSVMQLPGVGVPLKDYKSFFKTYKNCFRGTKCIQWLVKKFSMSRKKALSIAEMLAEYNYIVLATNKEETSFKDERALYCFAFQNNNSNTTTEVDSDFLDAVIDVISAGLRSDENATHNEQHAAEEPRGRDARSMSVQEDDAPVSPRSLSMGLTSPLSVVTDSLPSLKLSEGSEPQSSPAATGGGGSKIVFSNNKKASTSSKRKKAKDIAQAKDSEDLKFENVDGTYRVMAGSIKRLLEVYLFSPTIDTPYRDAFLLTYRRFTSPQEMFDALKQIWHEGQSRTTRNIEDDTMAIKALEQRIITLMKAWFDKCIKDVLPLASDISEFVKEFMVPKYGVVASRLLNVLEENKDGGITKNLRRTYQIEFKEKPWTEEGVSLVSWNTNEVAQQCALYHHALYLRIEEEELLGQGWSKANGKELSPNVLAVIDAFNRLSSIAMTEIVCSAFLKDRVNSVQKYIDLAMQLANLHEFAGCMAIYSALNSAPIQRLKKTWEALSNESKEKLTHLSELLSHNRNYSMLRTTVKTSPAPVNPYIGIYLQDLTFIEEIPAKVGDLINWSKYWKIANTVNEILDHQKSTFTFEANPKILDWLLNKPINQGEEIYQISLKVEPRDLEKAIAQMMELETTMNERVKHLEVQIDGIVRENSKLVRSEEIARSELKSAVQMLHSAIAVITSHDEALSENEKAVLAVLKNFARTSSGAPPPFIRGATMSRTVEAVISSRAAANWTKPKDLDTPHE